MDDILSHALEDYRSEFGETFDPSWNPTSEQDLVVKLQASKLDFATWRSKHEKLWRTLSTIATPVIQLGQITSKATGNACPPASAALGGLVAIIQACESVTEAYDFLEQMLAKLQDALSRWKIDLRHDLDDQMKQQMRQIMVILLAIIARAQRLVKHSRARRYFVNLAFGKDQKTADLMKQLENLLRSEDRARLALSLDKISSLWERAVHAEDARVVERLKTPAVEINSRIFAERREERLENTGDWFRKEPLYQYWLQHKMPLLMLLGGQGTGKTFLATALLEDLQKLKNDQPDSSQGAISFAYFFVKPADDLVTVLKSLAYQIQQVNPDYRSHVIDTYDQQDLYTAREIWSKLFLEYWNSGDISEARVMLVIDGLDDIADEEIQTFAQDMVKTVMQWPDCTIQVAVFGRLKLWADFDFIGRERFIMVESHKNRADIAEYIDQELAKVRVLKKAEAKEKLKFQQMILKCCDGVFEWARLLLAKCKNQEKKRILKTLEDPPKSLDDMIESCFQQILKDEDVDSQMLQVMLTWLTYAKRPLNFGELYDKVCLATGDEYTLMWYNIIAKLSSIVRWRTPRVRQWHGQEIGDDEIEVLEDAEEGWSKDVSSTVIMFGNTRIRDYVIHQSKSMSQAGSHSDHYPPPQNKAECDIVKICLETIQGDRLRDKKHRFLLRYPARFLARHLQCIDIDLADEEDKLTIANGLIFMFHTKQAIQILSLDIQEENDGLQAFWQIWMETDQYVRTVQSWLKWACDANLGTDTDTKTWLRLASVSIKELFRPWADSVRHEWLTKHFPPGVFESFEAYDSLIQLAIHFVPAFDHMDDQGLVPERFRTYHSLHVHGSSAEDVISTANKSDLPKNADFHLAIALALEEVDQSAASITYAKTAFEMDETSWSAAWLLAKAFVVFDCESALYWSDIARNLNPIEKARISSARALWFAKCNKIDEALEAAKEGLEAGGDQLEVQAVYFWCLHHKKDHAAILQYFKALGVKQRENEKDGSLSQLAHLLLGEGMPQVIVWGTIGQAYRSCQSPADQEYVLTTLKEATALLVRNHGDSSQIRWFMEYALFYCIHVADGLETGIDMLEKIVDRLNEGKSELDEVERLGYLVDTIYHCGFWRWQQAIWYKRLSNPALPQVVDALKKLETRAGALKVSELAATRAYSAAKATLFYSQWIHTNEPEQGDIWKQMFKKPVLEHLAMLDDSDPRNDLWGITHLASILAMAGDVDNVHALYSVMLLRVKSITGKMKARAQLPGDSDGTKADPETSDPQEPADAELHTSLSKVTIENGSSLIPTSNSARMSNSAQDKDIADATLSLNLDTDLHFVCNACVSMAIDLEDLFLCMTCGRKFCGACMPTTSEQYFWGRACGNHHEFVQIWPVSAESAHTVAVERNGELRLKKAWLEALRAQWQAVE